MGVASAGHCRRKCRPAGVLYHSAAVSIGEIAHAGEELASIAGDLPLEISAFKVLFNGEGSYLKSC